MVMFVMIMFVMENRVMIIKKTLVNTTSFAAPHVVKSKVFSQCNPPTIIRETNRQNLSSKQNLFPGLNMIKVIKMMTMITNLCSIAMRMNTSMTIVFSSGSP